ncbi:Abi family protein [Enterococcus wangshanyuanii]|uniref:CAAX protease n=1 Tax=Enterococcus wangshanyuanii TaxID=2005703 RepID=A0ABQ1NEL4_9ENTE|nr:Abi family protein [Enterococcus wangshanyuanii]GGC74677.1 hypothetical protein GCM10011573_00220 [Enterococcus wangshanyuanii]
MESEKIFLTWHQQVEKLASRNLYFSDKNEKEQAKQILQNNSYYALVNGYKNILNVVCVNGEDDFQGESFHDLNQSYTFDKELSAIIFKYLLRIEDSIKAIFSYYLGEQFGHKNVDYLLEANYKSGNYVNNAGKYERDILLDKLNKIISESNAVQIKHYREEHGYAPPWVLASSVSLDTLMYWFKLSRPTIKKQVVKTLLYDYEQYPFSHITSIEENIELFSNMMTIVKEYRNRAAHGNRIMNHLSKHNLRIHLIQLYSDNRIELYEEYKNGSLNRDFFSLCVTMVIMLSKREDMKNKFISELQLLFKNLETENRALYKLLMSNIKLPGNFNELLKGIINTK